MAQYDITFVGHMCYDEIIHRSRNEHYINPGSAVLCGAMAAGRIGKKVAVVTRMAKKDDAILDEMRRVGIDMFYTETSETSMMLVDHPSDDPDDRIMKLKQNAGAFTMADLPADLETRHLHLAGISDQEFSLEFIRALKAKGFHLSTDMQSYVRQAHPQTRDVSYGDVPEKQTIASLMERVKLDVVEAGILTGTEDLARAAEIVESWGCPEILITQGEGVLARAQGQNFYEKFSNKTLVGRTGRGDTTFAGYLARRMDHDVPESLKFAASLVSIKMESVGPFKGTIDDVLERMRLDGRS
jgi:sugar/nucleoside kinase (ribokinase family)